MACDTDERLWSYYQRENTTGFDKGSHDKLMIISKIIKKHTSNSDRLCEIGLGNGLLIKTLSNNRKMIGVDLCKDVIEHLRSKEEFSRIVLKHGDITQINHICKDENINIFITIDVIEHLDDSKLFETCQIISEILPRNGKWFINVPWNEDLKRNEILCPHCMSTFHRVGHKQSFDEKRLTLLMEQFGFKVGLMNKIYPMNFTLPSPLVFMYRIIARLYLKEYASLFAMMVKS